MLAPSAYYVQYGGQFLSDLRMTLHPKPLYCREPTPEIAPPKGGQNSLSISLLQGCCLPTGRECCVNRILICSGLCLLSWLGYTCRRQSLFITRSKANHRGMSRDCSSRKSSMEWITRTSGVFTEENTGLFSSPQSTWGDLASLLSTAQTLHFPTSHEHTRKHCRSNLLNLGQSVSRLKRCIRWELYAAFNMCVLSLYLISTGTMGYLWISPCTHLTSTHCLELCTGLTRFWWPRSCMQPESTKP